MKNKVKLLVISILIILNAKFNPAIGQATVFGNALSGASSSAPNEFLGSDASTGTLYDVVFKAANVEGMRMLQSNRRVGIGTNAPNELLEVVGNVRIGSSNAFMLGDNPIIWNNDQPYNLMVGVGAGNSANWGCGTCANTLVGYLAGNAFNDGEAANTFIGHQAGGHAKTQIGSGIGCVNNTAVGLAALDKTKGYGGCAFGSLAAFYNNFGCSITAMGKGAMYHNTDGNNNTAIGHEAMFSNTTLGNNIAIGLEALFMQDLDPGVGCSFPYDYDCQSSNNVAVGNQALYWTNPTSWTGTDIDDGKNNTPRWS